MQGNILTSCNLNHRYDPDRIMRLAQFLANQPLSMVYNAGKQYFVNRFLVATTPLDKKFGFMATTIGTR